MSSKLGTIKRLGRMQYPLRKIGKAPAVRILMKELISKAKL